MREQTVGDSMDVNDFVRVIIVGAPSSAQPGQFDGSFNQGSSNCPNL